MAIDTRSERSSVLGIVEPDGVIDARDRKTILGIYARGIPATVTPSAFSAVVTVETATAFAGSTPVTVSPSVISIVSTVEAPSATGAATVPVSIIELVVSAPLPSISTEATIEASSISAAVTVQAPTIIADSVTVTYYVDPDAAGTGDGTSWADAYTSLQAAQSAEAKDLVTANEKVVFLCRSSAGTADTVRAWFRVGSNWVTDSTHTITIKAAEGQEALKTGWDESRYRISVTDSSGIVNSIGFDGSIEGLQVEAISAGNSVAGISEGSLRERYFSVRRCRIQIDATLAPSCDGAYGISQLFSSIVTVKAPPSSSSIYAARNWQLPGPNLTSNTIFYIDSDTVGYGYLYNSGGINVVNSVCIGGVGSWVIYPQSVLPDHCSPDNGYTTNSVDPLGGDWDNEFRDVANGDFTLLDTGNLYQAGIAVLDGPELDIDGNTWDDPPSIGAAEFVYFIQPIAVDVTLETPSISGQAAVYPDTVQAEATLLEPSATGLATITPASLEAATTVESASPSGSSSFTATTLQAEFSLLAASQTGLATATPVVVLVETTLHAPSIIASSGAVLPEVLVEEVTVHSPTLSYGMVVSPEIVEVFIYVGLSTATVATFISPDALVAEGSVYEPSVSGPADVSAETILSLLSIEDPTVLGAVQVVVTADLTEAEYQIPTADIGAAAIVPSVSLISTEVSIYDPGVAGDARFTTTPLRARMRAFAPTTSYGWVVSPDVLEAEYTFPTHAGYAGIAATNYIYGRVTIQQIIAGDCTKQEAILGYCSVQQTIDAEVSI